MLHGIKREVLPHLLFPVGGYTKPQIRALAREAGLLRVAEKPDSVEICFVPSGNHTDVVRAPPAGGRGARASSSRRTAPCSANTTASIASRSASARDSASRPVEAIRAGDCCRRRTRSSSAIESDLLATGLIASRGELAHRRPPDTPFACTAKIRYRHAGVPATVTATPDGGADVRFDEPQPAVTPGQAVAFYDGTRVLGGGWIENAVR